MTIDRDPALQDLFSTARKELEDDAFTAEVMSRVNKLRRRMLVSWVVVGLVLAVGVGVLSGPLLVAVNLATQLLPESLIELDDRLLAQILSPVNSVAGLLGLGFLALRLLYKKIF